MKTEITKDRRKRSWLCKKRLNGFKIKYSLNISASTVKALYKLHTYLLTYLVTRHCGGSRKSQRQTTARELGFVTPLHHYGVL